MYKSLIKKNALISSIRFRRQIFVTPKSFLSFVNGYKSLYTKNKQEIEEMKVQRLMGLEKLADASVQVEVLKKELIEKEKEIITATAASKEVKLSNQLYTILIIKIVMMVIDLNRFIGHNQSQRCGRSCGKK